MFPEPVTQSASLFSDAHFSLDKVYVGYAVDMIGVNTSEMVRSCCNC